MIKIVQSPFVGGRPYRSKTLCMSRKEALAEAQRQENLGRAPIIQRPLPGTKGWYVWYKL